MKKYFICLMMTASFMAFGACAPDDYNQNQTPGTENPGNGNAPDEPGTPDNPDTPDGTGENPGTPDTPGENGKILTAYFSWSGTTKRMAEEIVRQTGSDIFRIEPTVPYPTAYTPCTEVAQEEKNSNARLAISGTVENWDEYDTIFIGCPVWWWTTPMIICTFAESYDFKGKTVIPFCTYAATYRDETLARIVELTPDAGHLTGEGLTSGQINAQAIGTWLRNIGIVK